MLRTLVRARPMLLAVALVAIAFASTPLRGQEVKFPFKGKERPTAKSGSTGTELKKYDDVITKEAKTSVGVFLVHRIQDKVYFEIPQDSLGKLMLWTIEVAKGPAGVSWGGQALGSRVVRWERRGNKIFLWNVSFTKRADGKAVQRAVDSANMDSIIYAFNVEAEGKDRSAVIQTTPLFLTDVPDFSIKGAVTGGGSIDDGRSYVEEVKTFPTNIEIRSLLTFRSSGAGSAIPGLPTGGRGGAGGGGRSYTAVLHYSLVQLPENPMMGRFFDPRVGYFTRSFEDYAGNKGWMETKQFINRFRLEKKDPRAEVSEPVKPIVYYLSREIPEKWRPYLKKGVEDWAPAFEKAGFKNAIICKDAPSEREDPNWDAEDARHSVIRWVAEPTQNAMGPNTHDPRSGEIISAHIIFWHDIVKLVQLWYFVQCGASDPRVKSLPLDDEIIGDCLRYVCCHEVGHTLGLRHNHRASQAYSIPQLRDPKFVEKHGSVASIMSYGRFNYVAQPEDKMTRFLPLLAPYDFFAIHWGYQPIPGARTPEDEKKTLDEWASRQIKEPFLRFGGEDGPSQVDPTVLTENIGSDAIEATELGLKNLDRLLDKIIPATTKVGEDYSLLQDAYKAVLQHRGLWFGAVAKQVGGVVESRTLGGRGDESFSRLSRDRQRQAVKFLLLNAFMPPRKLVNPVLVNRFKYAGVADEILNGQKALLSGLLSGRRFRMLLDAEVINPSEAYTASQFLGDVQEGLWSELRQQQPTIDALRRALQRAYLDQIKDELAKKDSADGPTLPVGRRGPRGDDGPSSATKGTDYRAVVRAGLQDLAKTIELVLVRVQDPMTKAHLQDSLREIKLILNPKD